MTLPKFKYHPDPLKTGSVEESDALCECCGEAKGYIYVGPVFSEEELADCICPWCIASGKAHDKFDAEFTDFDGIGDYGSWEEIPKEIKEEVSYRTPGFSGWQQERWWTHCNDAAEFLGAAGKKEIEEYGEELVAELKKETGYDDEEWSYYYKNMDKNGSPTAYIFRCLHCGKLGGYSDCD